MGNSFSFRLKRRTKMRPTLVLFGALTFFMVMEVIEGVGFRGGSLSSLSRGRSALGRAGSALGRGGSSLKSRGRSGLSRGRSALSRGREKSKGLFSRGKDKLRGVFSRGKDKIKSIFGRGRDKSTPGDISSVGAVGKQKSTGADKLLALGTLAGAGVGAGTLYSYFSGDDEATNNNNSSYDYQGYDYSG